MNQNISASKKTNRKHFGKFIIFILLIVLVAFLLVTFISKNNSPKDIIPTVSSEPQTPPDQSVTMTIIGDIMCHNTNYKEAYDPATKTYDFSSVFSQIAKYASAGDITIGNFETTMAGESRGYSGYPTFNTPAALATDIKELGIDVVSTA